MKIYKKAILPLGFQASGVASGIKRSGKLDLALLYSVMPAKAACRFTLNKIQAAPIRLNKAQLKRSKNFQAIVVNSGNANCFNGKAGLRHAEETAGGLAMALGIRKENVLVASTGIIGRRLPLAKIKKAIPGLLKGLSRQGINQAKRAILTTDRFVKEITAEFKVGKSKVSVCGIAKGAGMIAPNTATMLAFILTDALISQQALNKALGIAVESSFHSISVDGCMSTNDSIILLANARAGNKLIDKGKDFDTFASALGKVCLELAKMIIRDAEGATKFIQIRVVRAKSFQQARKAALSIANSNLFKTAVYGENPNFGRIIAAVGASGIEVREEDIKIKVSPLKRKEIKVEVFLNQGKGSSTVYTSDLTPAYIRINAAYN